MYLYSNKRDTFDLIQRYLDQVNEKKSKLIINDDGTVNLTYTLTDGIKTLYSDDQSDITKWIEEHNYLQDGQYDVVMYGLGLTQHLAKLIEINSKLNFFIMEPEIDIFVEALKIVEIDQLLEHPQVKQLTIGNHPIHFKLFHSLVSTYSSLSQIDVYIPYYAQINIEDMRAFYEYNYLIRESRLIEIGFEKQFGTLPYRNSINNIEKMLLSQPISELHNKFEGCTALVVGGGPSLAVDAEEIKKHKDKLLIIAAGSSIQSLLTYGIEPHLMVSMDPGSANGKVYEKIESSEIPLVFVPQIYANILNIHPKHNYYAWFQNDVIINYLFSDIKVDYNFVPTNSVSGTAIQVAKYLGANQILFAGQDCSFPNNEFYAQGVEHVSESQLKKKIAKGNLEVENVNGTTNYTDISMKSVLENIERLISTIDDVTFINTSSLGAKIKGADYVPFLEATKNIQSNNFNFSELRLSFKNESTTNSITVEGALSRIRKFKSTCEQLIDYSEASLKLIGKIDEQSRRQPDKAMNTLAKLEQQFSKVTRNAMFEDIITVWNRGLTRNYDQQVIRIAKEPTMIGKTKLLNEIVVPFIEAIINSFRELIKEFQQLQEKLTQIKEQ
ncbi:motility associated factor glycosyltransferase family protein [Paenibacillus septentrionalis]